MKKNKCQVYDYDNEQKKGKNKKKSVQLATMLYTAALAVTTPVSSVDLCIFNNDHKTQDDFKKKKKKEREMCKVLNGN